MEFGPGLQYEIKYKCAHSRLLWQRQLVAGDLSQYTIEACTSEDVHIYIKARNSEGPCELDTVKILVPQHTKGIVIFYLLPYYVLSYIVTILYTQLY